MQLNNNIHRIVRRVLNEELGINQEVYDASNQVFELIQTDFKKHNIHGIELNDVNGKVYSNMVEFSIHSKKVNILYNFYYFDTENDYLAYKKQNPSITQAETNTTDNADEFLIKVNYVVYDGVLNDMLFDQMQHELNHAFQQIISGKKYTYGKVRQHIEKIPKALLNDKEIRCANFILYMSRNFEQDAFANGLYSSLMRNNEYDINNSGAVHNLKQLQGAIRMLSSCQDDAKFKSNFGISKNRIIKYGEKSVTRLTKLINRVIFKYGKDTGNNVSQLFI